MRGPRMSEGSAPLPEGVEPAVSEAVAGLYLDKFGKGPLHCETFVNGDVLTTVMHDVFTRVERELAANGKSDSVLTNRMLWQEATDPMFKEVVGQATGREVLTVVSGYEVHREVATEVFILAPQPE